jgi:hypothetical protein
VGVKPLPFIKGNEMNIEAMKESVIVDDDHILLGKPIELQKYGKVLKIRQLNWFYEWPKFSYNLAVFLMYYNQVLENGYIPATVDELENFKNNIQAVIVKNGVINRSSKNKAWKSLVNICKLSGVSVRWMKKKFSLDDWIELFLYFYLFNIMGKKKGLKDVFSLIGIHQSNWSQLKPKYTSGSKKRIA